MKKSIAFAVVAVVVAGAGYRYSRRNVSLAISPIERQSLHDAPNDALQKFGLDSTNAAPVATPAAAGNAGGNAGAAGSQKLLTADELSQIKALAMYAYEHGKKGALGLEDAREQVLNLNYDTWSLESRFKQHQFCVSGVVQSDGSLKPEVFLIGKHIEINGSFGILPDGTRRGGANLDPQDRAEFEKDLSFWLGFAEAHGLGLDGLNVGE
jgi:hypothetical protein